VVESPNCLPLGRLLPLANQIVDQTNCPSGVTVIRSLANLSAAVDVSQAPYPYLAGGAWNSLQSVAVAGAASGLPAMRVTRALEPFLFEYYAFRRGFLRICGVAESQPYVGASPFGEGSSVEVANADEWAAFFDAAGAWQRVGRRFTYAGPDALHAGRRTLQTFQLMWSSAGERMQCRVE
jgi:hypothetical protein